MRSEQKSEFKNGFLMDEQNFLQGHIVETKLLEMLKTPYCQGENDEIHKNVQIIVFVGDSKYPARTNLITNVPPFGLYSKYGFSVVAFMCDKLTLEMCSIMAVLFGSVDAGARFAVFLVLKN